MDCPGRISCKCSCQLWCIAAYMGRGCWSYSGYRSESQGPRGVGTNEHVLISCMAPCWLKWFWNMLTISVALCSISQCQLQKASRLQQWLFLLWNQLEMMSLLTFSGGKSILQPHLSKSVSHSCRDVENTQGGTTKACQLVISQKRLKHILGSATMKHST